MSEREDPPTGPPIGDDTVSTDDAPDGDVHVDARREDVLRPRAGALVGSAVLVVVAFAATLILLIGLAQLVTPDPISTASDGAVSASAPSGGSGGSGAASAAGDDVAILVGAGDIADCRLSGDEATAELLDRIDGTVFTAGDNAYEDGTPQEFAACYAPSWGRHLQRTRPAPGNHDRGDGNLDGYRGYFGTAAFPDDTSWYAYDLGTWRIIVLDTDCAQDGSCDINSDQGRWLTNELERSGATCTLAILHHPRFSSGEHGDIEGVAPLWEALYAAGVDVVVSGHDHDYERFAPQDPSGQPDSEAGIRQIVAGTGGANLRPFVRDAPNSEVRSDDDHGVLRLALGDGSYEWTFISTASDFGDSGADACH